MEELDREHLGLEEMVRSLMSSGKSYDSIRVAVIEKYGVEIAISTLSSFYQRRFAPDLQAQAQAIRNARARVELLRQSEKDGDGDAGEMIRLMLQAQILEHAEDLGAADPLELLKESRRHEEGKGHLEIERGKLAVAEKDSESKRIEAEAKLKEAERKSKELEAKLEAVQATVKKVGTVEGHDVSDHSPILFDEKKALRKINELIGVGGAMEEHAEAVESGE